VNPNSSAAIGINSNSKKINPNTSSSSSSTTTGAVVGNNKKKLLRRHSAAVETVKDSHTISKSKNSGSMSSRNQNEGGTATVSSNRREIAATTAKKRKRKTHEFEKNYDGPDPPKRSTSSKKEMRRAMTEQSSLVHKESRKSGPSKLKKTQTTCGTSHDNDSTSYSSKTTSSKQHNANTTGGKTLSRSKHNGNLTNNKIQRTRKPPPPMFSTSSEEEEEEDNDESNESSLTPGDYNNTGGSSTSFSNSLSSCFPNSHNDLLQLENRPTSAQSQVISEAYQQYYDQNYPPQPPQPIPGYHNPYYPAHHPNSYPPPPPGHQPPPPGHQHQVQPPPPPNYYNPYASPVLSQQPQPIYQNHPQHPQQPPPPPGYQYSHGPPPMYHPGYFQDQNQQQQQPYGGNPYSSGGEEEGQMSLPRPIPQHHGIGNPHMIPPQTPVDLPPFTPVGSYAPTLDSRFTPVSHGGHGVPNGTNGNQMYGPHQQQHPGQVITNQQQGQQPTGTPKITPLISSLAPRSSAGSTGQVLIPIPGISRPISEQSNPINNNMASVDQQHHANSINSIMAIRDGVGSAGSSYNQGGGPMSSLSRPVSGQGGVIVDQNQIQQQQMMGYPPMVAMHPHPQQVPSHGPSPMPMHATALQHVHHPIPHMMIPPNSSQKTMSSMKGSSGQESGYIGSSNSKHDRNSLDRFLGEQLVVGEDGKKSRKNSTEEDIEPVQERKTSTQKQPLAIEDTKNETTSKPARSSNLSEAFSDNFENNINDDIDIGVVGDHHHDANDIESDYGDPHPDPDAHLGLNLKDDQGNPFVLEVEQTKNAEKNCNDTSVIQESSASASDNTLNSKALSENTAPSENTLVPTFSHPTDANNSHQRFFPFTPVEQTATRDDYLDMRMAYSESRVRNPPLQPQANFPNTFRPMEHQRGFFVEPHHPQYGPHHPAAVRGAMRTPLSNQYPSNFPPMHPPHQHIQQSHPQQFFHYPHAHPYNPNVPYGYMQHQHPHTHYAYGFPHHHHPHTQYAYYPPDRTATASASHSQSNNSQQLASGVEKGNLNIVQASQQQQSNVTPQLQNVNHNLQNVNLQNVNLQNQIQNPPLATPTAMVPKPHRVGGLSAPRSSQTLRRTRSDAHARVRFHDDTEILLNSHSSKSSLASSASGLSSTGGSNNNMVRCQSSSAAGSIFGGATRRLHAHSGPPKPLGLHHSDSDGAILPLASGMGSTSASCFQLHHATPCHRIEEETCYGAVSQATPSSRVSLNQNATGNILSARNSNAISEGVKSELQIPSSPSVELNLTNVSTKKRRATIFKRSESKDTGGTGGDEAEVEKDDKEEELIQAVKSDNEEEENADARLTVESHLTTSNRSSFESKELQDAAESALEPLADPSIASILVKSHHPSDPVILNSKLNSLVDNNITPNLINEDNLLGDLGDTSFAERSDNPTPKIEDHIFETLQKEHSNFETLVKSKDHHHCDSAHLNLSVGSNLYTNEGKNLPLTTPAGGLKITPEEGFPLKVTPEEGFPEATAGNASQKSEQQLLGRDGDRLQISEMQEQFNEFQFSPPLEDIPERPASMQDNLIQNQNQNAKISNSSGGVPGVDSLFPHFYSEPVVFQQQQQETLQQNHQQPSTGSLPGLRRMPAGFRPMNSYENIIQNTSNMNNAQQVLQPQVPQQRNSFTVIDNSNPNDEENRMRHELNKTRSLGAGLRPIQHPTPQYIRVPTASGCQMSIPSDPYHYNSQPELGIYHSHSHSHSMDPIRMHQHHQQQLSNFGRYANPNPNLSFPPNFNNYTLNAMSMSMPRYQRHDFGDHIYPQTDIREQRRRKRYTDGSKRGLNEVSFSRKIETATYSDGYEKHLRKRRRPNRHSADGDLEGVTSISKRRTKAEVARYRADAANRDERNRKKKSSSKKRQLHESVSDTKHESTRKDFRKRRNTNHDRKRDEEVTRNNKDSSRRNGNKKSKVSPYRNLSKPKSTHRKDHDPPSRKSGKKTNLKNHFSWPPCDSEDDESEFTSEDEEEELLDQEEEISVPNSQGSSGHSIIEEDNNNHHDNHHDHHDNTTSNEVSALNITLDSGILTHSQSHKKRSRPKRSIPNRQPSRRKSSIPFSEDEDFGSDSYSKSGKNDILTDEEAICSRDNLIIRRDNLAKTCSYTSNERSDRDNIRQQLNLDEDDEEEEEHLEEELEEEESISMEHHQHLHDESTMHLDSPMMDTIRLNQSSHRRNHNPTSSGKTSESRSGMKSSSSATSSSSTSVISTPPESQSHNSNSNTHNKNYGEDNDVDTPSYEQYSTNDLGGGINLSTVQLIKPEEIEMSSPYELFQPTSTKQTPNTSTGNGQTSSSSTTNNHINYGTSNILGYGASGIVLRATHKPTGVPLAVKVINMSNISADSEEAQLLTRDVYNGIHLAELDSPFLCRMYAAFMHPSMNAMHIVLEFMDLGSLADVFRGVGNGGGGCTTLGYESNATKHNNANNHSNSSKRNKRHQLQEMIPASPCPKISYDNGISCGSQIIFPEPILAFIVMQILEGIKTLHLSDIVHRDIKSENILISSDAEIKLTDFGVSRKLEAGEYECQTFVGTYYDYSF